MADLVRFVFSVSGLVTALAAAALWTIVRPRSASTRGLLAFIILFYGAASVYTVSHAAARLVIGAYQPLEARDVPSGPTAVVLLGSGTFTARDWRDGRFLMLDPQGADRVVEAARVYHLIDPAWVISSGGAIGPVDPSTTAGQVMRDALVTLGVPPERILMETRSETTRDEAVIVKAMLAPLGVQHVVLVTSDVHMRRSMGTFRAVGFDPIPAIARRPRWRAPWNLDAFPSGVGLDEAGAAAHEVLGIGYYRLKGWYRFN